MASGKLGWFPPQSVDHSIHPLLTLGWLLNECHGGLHRAEGVTGVIMFDVNAVVRFRASLLDIQGPSRAE
jgi:hypothetical protein